MTSLVESALLIDFLSEILYLTDADKEVYNKVEIHKLDGKNLETKLFGAKVDGLDLEIKTATYGRP